jgi:exodeoxyribonuclease-1
MNNFIFYDTETTGLEERDFIQIIQIGSIYTNSDLKTIDEIDLLCRPLPWTLVTPKALLVNKKIEIFDAQLTHYVFMKKIRDTWMKWTQKPAVFVTYNGMFFDEELIRRQFFWNLMDPYMTNTDGNTRLDLLPKLAPIYTFYRDQFFFPTVNGKVSFKLEAFAKALNIETANAHDALTDCIFLKELLKSIKDKLPNYFIDMMEKLQKNEQAERLSTEINIFTTRTGKYFPFLLLDHENLNSNKRYIYNLNFDPIVLLNHSLNELKQCLLDKDTNPLKKINISHTQPVIKLSTLEADNIDLEIDRLELEKRKNFIEQNPELIERILAITSTDAEKSYDHDYPEQMIYSMGFPDQYTKDIFKKFHECENAKDCMELINRIDNKIYSEFASRICAQRYPNDVPEVVLRNCKNLISQRFNEEGPWPKAKTYLAESKKLLESATDSNERKLIGTVINSIESNLS